MVKRKKKTLWQLPPISLDVDEVERQFSEAEEAKRMIVHEQLQAMERFALASPYNTIYISVLIFKFCSIHTYIQRSWQSYPTKIWVTTSLREYLARPENDEAGSGNRDNVHGKATTAHEL